MFKRQRYQNGYSLVELLITMMIFGIFSGAVYSMYITHLKTAYSRDKVIDVQQNVRIAMDRLTRDIRMAGLFVTPPFDVLNSYSTAISIQTTPMDMKRVTISQMLSEDADKFVVTPSATLTDIGLNSTAVILRSTTKTRVGGIFTVISSVSANGHLKVNPKPTYPDVPVPGDIVLQVTTFPNVILYRIDRVSTANGCNISPCLMRNSDIIAQAIDKIRFEYYLDGANTSPKLFLNSTSASKVTGVRVTVTSSHVQVKQNNYSTNRSLKSFVKLRNSR